MSQRNIPQPAIWSIDKFIRNLMEHISNIHTGRNWVNGRPVLINGDVWCPMCEIWHANNSYCQQSY